MADDTDELVAQSGDTGSDTAPLSWPLVERRRGSQPPPGGIDRRGPRPALTTPQAPTLSAAPLWPFRLAALAGAVARAINGDGWNDWKLVMATAAMAVYTVIAIVRPVAYRNDNKVRLRIVVEQALVTVLILVTGAWSSPFALCLIPSGMLAGFAAGGVFSIQLAAAAVAAITFQHVPAVGARLGLQDGAVWAGLLALVAFTSGLAHRAAFDSARQQQLALDRVSMLAEANSLLFALQRVAQTLPASLDLDDVLDSTVGRVSAMIDHDSLVVFLFNDRERVATPIRAHGVEEPTSYSVDYLPPGLRAALDSPKTVRLVVIPPGGALSGTGRSGLYAALRARGSLVGLIAVESNRTDAFGQQQAEIVHGLTEPFGIAIDNARMFAQIRTLAADEERSRIARDLHDHIGSSLAMIGFEIDRATSVAHDGGPVEPVLRELRSQVTAVVADVRDTLYDLRTEITERKDFRTTLGDFLARVDQRAAIKTSHDVRINGRLPLLQERELWQIVREAITNAERHSEGAHLDVLVRETTTTFTAIVRDDGIGLGKATVRADSYGMIGMRERAARIGAQMSVRTPDPGGTEVRVDIGDAEGSQP